MAEGTPTGDQGPRTVLLVDDDDDLRRTLVSALNKGGYRVIDADSAERGLQLAETAKGPIDLAFLDIMLPDSWGAQLVPALRMAHPDIRVIFMSGYTDTDPVLRAAIGSETAFLAKPFDVAELLALVEEVLAAEAEPGEG